MPKYPMRHVTETEARLETLYALDLLGASSAAQLLEFMVENDLMNYFDLQLALYALCEGGQTAQSNENGAERYSLTDAGRETLALFGNRIPATAKGVIDISAAPWREHFKNAEAVAASTGKTEHGEYTAKLQIFEKGAAIMTLEIAFPSEELAAHTKRCWPSKAGAVYKAIMRAMAEEAKP